MIEIGALLILGAMVLGSALGVVVSANNVYCALFLIVNLFGLAICFLLLNAVFIAAAQVLIYAGAVVVLFLFVITLLSSEADKISRDRHPWQRNFGLLCAGGLGALLTYLIAATVFGEGSGLDSRLGIPTAPTDTTNPSVFNGTTEGFGKAIFGDFLFPFEITAFILLVGLIGAVALNRQQGEERRDKR